MGGHRGSKEAVEALGGACSAAVQRVEIQGAAVRAVSCGDTHCVAVGAAGAVFTWGSGRDWALGSAPPPSAPPRPAEPQAFNRRPTHR